MYQKLDYVNYGAHGICRIEDIRMMDFHTGGGTQKYFVMKPLNQENTTFYLPADNPKVRERMRPILSQTEIDAILDSVKNKQMPWISDRKVRQAQFQQILSGRDERELLLLAGCLHQRLLEKGLPTSELDILHRVEGIIEQEFSFSLQISRQEIGEYIRERLQ